MQTVAEFESCVGESFQIALSDGVLDLKLSEVTTLGSGVREGGAFSVVFEGAEEVHLPQGMYRLVGAGRDVEVFLVPIGPFGQGMGFEAVFT